MVKSPEFTKAAARQAYEDITNNRTKVLRELLGVDYGYALDDGLIDMYHYNPVTGHDGLIHTLAGDYRPGTTLPSGFHHAPSGEVTWPHVVNKRGRSHPVTRTLDAPRIYPMEPYKSTVAIGGLRKKIMTRDPATGELSITENTQDMFPNEYDALAVLQSIRIAKQRARRLSNKNARDPSTIKLEGKAPLIDGKSTMTIRMVIEPSSGGIVTAYPRTKGRPIMKLTNKQMWAHILAPTPAPGE
jgi:hypothetical protein